MCNFLLLLLSLIPLATLGAALPRPVQDAAHVTIARKPLETWLSIVDDTKPTHTTTHGDASQVSSTTKQTHIDPSQVSPTTKPTHTIVHVERDQTSSSTESLVSNHPLLSVSGILKILPRSSETSVLPTASCEARPEQVDSDVASGRGSSLKARRQLVTNPFVAVGDDKQPEQLHPHVASGEGSSLEARQLDPAIFIGNDSPLKPRQLDPAIFIGDGSSVKPRQLDPYVRPGDGSSATPRSLNPYVALGDDGSSSVKSRQLDPAIFIGDGNS